MKETRIVDAADPSGHRVLIETVACLVAEGPEDDGRMVFVPLDHVHGAVEEGVRPTRVVAKISVVVMGLQIRFIYKVYAVFVAEVVPIRVVWIVRRADGVEIELLEELDVLHHRLARDGLAVAFVEIMAVDAFDENRLAVHKQLAIFDFHRPETEADGCAFDDGAFRIQQ